MDDATRSFVAERAGRRCEYCLFNEDDDVDFFHVEHVVAKKHGGSDDTDNLAFACQHCNLHKGPNLTGVDPQSGSQDPVALFHPRRDAWGSHFRFDGARILGVTAIGRATVSCLNMNASYRVEVRAFLGYTDRFG